MICEKIISRDEVHVVHEVPCSSMEQNKIYKFEIVRIYILIKYKEHFSKSELHNNSKECFRISSQHINQDWKSACYC